MARGINDVVVAVVASPQSTVIGGATQTVRDLVAAWEQRDVMAREVAIDVAFHSPQVDPILGELTDALAELQPDDTGSSLLLGDPVRPARAAGVRCRLLGGQCAPHGAVRRGGAGRFGGRPPGLRRAGAAPPADPRSSSRPPAASTCRWPPWPACAANKRCHTGCVALWRICTVRAPRSTSQCSTRMGGWWTRRCRPGRTVGCCSAATIRNCQRMAVAPLPCIRCWARMCACRRNRSATSGKGRSAPPPSPGWAITRSAMWQCFRGRPTARWRWRPRTPCWARLPRSATSASSRCCCWMSRPRSAPRRRCHRRASSTSPWRQIRAANARGKLARRYMPQRMTQPPGYDIVHAACRASGLRGWRRGAQAHGPAWCSVRSGVHRSGRRAHWRRGNQHRAGRGRATPPNPLATRCLRCAPGAAGCLFPVRGGTSGRPGAGRRCAGAAVGYPSTPLLRCCPQRPLLLHAGDESRYFRGRGRPRRARRARGCPAHRAGPATGHRRLRAAATTIGCWPSGC